MDNLFQSKWFIRIISLVFAISLYIFVTVETNTTQSDSRFPGSTKEVQMLEEVPLDIKIDAEKYVVSGVPEHVTVSLEGTPSSLTPIVRQQKFTVYVDLNGLNEGEHLVEIEYENIPEEVKVYIEPKAIDIVIEERASKQFEVEIDYVNLDKLPLGYEIGEPEITPLRVNIVSSRSTIDQIAMVKVFIDVTDLKESIRNREVPVSVYDSSGNDLNVRIDPASVVVSIPIERPSKKVPLAVPTLGELPEGLELLSITAIEEIEIFGKRDILSEIDTIRTIGIDLSTIEESGKHQIELALPENIVANNGVVEVTIEIEQTKVFENVSIDMEGQGNKDITFVNPTNSMMSVTLIGGDKAVGKITKSDLTVFINVADLTEGEHQVTVEVEGPRGVAYTPEFEKVTIEVQ